MAEYRRWWMRREYPKFGERAEFGVSTIMSVLMEDAFNSGPPCLYKGFDGTLTIKPSEVVERLKGAGLHVVRVMPHKEYKEEGSAKYILANETTLVDLDLHGLSKMGSLNVASYDEKLFAKVLELQDVLAPDPAESGPVWTLAKNETGYSIMHLGKAGQKLTRDNYEEPVLRDYDHIVQDINTSSPCGRLVVLSGEPGTGKTFLIRSLLREAPDATFVLIPPQLVKDLGNPDILPALATAKQEIEGPIVLLAEDADMCLVRREADNMTTIQAVLNFGDGILGSLLDVRILITTNAPKFDMDKAALRKGRLCRHVEVGRLTATKARSIFERLVPQWRSLDEGVFEKETRCESIVSLGDVYDAARKYGWSPPSKDPVSDAKMRGVRSIDLL